MSNSAFIKLLPLYLVITVGFMGYALTLTLFIPMLLDTSFTILPQNSSIAYRDVIPGVLLSMYPLGQFVGSPVIGGLSDSYGRKKLLIFSLSGCIVGFLLISLSIHFKYIYLLFISAFLTGLCESNVAITQSVVADTFHDSLEKTKYMAYAYSSCSLGYIIGPLLGDYITYSFGYAGTFVITAIMVSALLVWIAISFNDSYVTKRDANSSNLFKAMTAMRSMFDEPKWRKIYVINFMIFFAVMGLYRVVPLLIETKWHPQLNLYSSIIIYTGILCFLANLFLIGKLANYFSTKKLLFSLLLLSGLLVALIPLPHHFNWIWLTFGAAVIPTVMALPTCTTWLSQNVTADKQGQALGNNQALLVLGEALSAAIGGLIAAININLPTFTMALILIITGIFVLLFKNQVVDSQLFALFQKF